VGHEINNPLTYLTGNLELAVDGLQRVPLHPDRVADIVSMLREASEGAVRIRDIVRGLRTFARSEEALHPTDIRGALNTAMSMAKHELRHRASLHEAVPPMPLVQANEARLAQIFLNLLVNAAQSFNGNDPSVNHVYVKAWKSPNDRVIVEFSDNGAGIAKELQSRIFDPFFTTKRLGEGTGLGLSISHSLVTSIKGEISCESEPGVGTKFRVSLPLADRPPLPRAKGPRTTPVPNARSGRVLIIDDEPGIARSMKQVLSQHHDAVAYVDPREACEALMREPESFDVVFCDLMMPFLTGMDLYKRLVERFPALAERFVFMTGASIEEQVARFLAVARNPPLEKPFTLDALRPIVDRLLRERDSRLPLSPVSQ
jgi:CheY-like chemotaxis protein/two-component sensor histidine kinase